MNIDDIYNISKQIRHIIFAFFKDSFCFYVGAFLAFSSLGAGLGKLTQKPLGAHQERILFAMKENTAVLIYRTNYEPFMRRKIWHHETRYINRIDSSFTSFHSYHSLIHYLAQRNKKNLVPNKITKFYSQTKKF